MTLHVTVAEKKQKDFREVIAYRSHCPMETCASKDRANIRIISNTVNKN